MIDSRFYNILNNNGYNANEYLELMRIFTGCAGFNMEALKFSTNPNYKLNYCGIDFGYFENEEDAISIEKDQYIYISSKNREGIEEPAFKYVNEAWNKYGINAYREGPEFFNQEDLEMKILYGISPSYFYLKGYVNFM